MKIGEKTIWVTIWKRIVPENKMDSQIKTILLKTTLVALLFVP